MGWQDGLAPAQLLTTHPRSSRHQPVKPSAGCQPPQQPFPRSAPSATAACSSSYEETSTMLASRNSRACRSRLACTSSSRLCMQRGCGSRRGDKGEEQGAACLAGEWQGSPRCNTHRFRHAAAFKHPPFRTAAAPARAPQRRPPPWARQTACPPCPACRGAPPRSRPAPHHGGPPAGEGGRSEAVWECLVLIVLLHAHQHTPHLAQQPNQTPPHLHTQRHALHLVLVELPAGGLVCRQAGGCSMLSAWRGVRGADHPHNLIMPPAPLCLRSAAPICRQPAQPAAPVVASSSTRTPAALRARSRPCTAAITPSASASFLMMGTMTTWTGGGREGKEGEEGGLLKQARRARGAGGGGGREAAVLHGSRQGRKAAQMPAACCQGATQPVRAPGWAPGGAAGAGPRRRRAS